MQSDQLLLTVRPPMLTNDNGSNIDHFGFHLISPTPIITPVGNYLMKGAEGKYSELYGI